MAKIPQLGGTNATRFDRWHSEWHNHSDLRPPPGSGSWYTVTIHRFKLALKMTGAVAQREQSPERAAEATNIRLRMFTLLSNAYEEIRRAVQFLRWHDEDADVIAPSIYSGRQNSTNGKKPNSETKPADTEPMTTPIVSQFAPPTSTSKTAVGMPNSDPFGG
jgi:hypothetical protein